MAPDTLPGTRPPRPGLFLVIGAAAYWLEPEGSRHRRLMFAPMPAGGGAPLWEDGGEFEINDPADRVAHDCIAAALMAAAAGTRGRP